MIERFSVKLIGFEQHLQLDFQLFHLRASLINQDLK